MNNGLLEKLKKWRLEAARNEGVAVYRVFANKTLEGIAAAEPKTKEELLAVKGIKEKKFAKYGEAVLELVNERNQVSIRNSVSKTGEKPYTVSRYLDFLNSSLRGQRARIKGEISSLDIRKGYLFFSLKDKDDGSLLGGMMWESDYRLTGIDFEEGMEIIVEGFAEVYKPIGRLTFKAFSAELVGEGALKKAYEALKKKLDSEGLFAPERKKPLPDFPQKIGLITSQTGAVIHDFLTNLGKHGFRVKFFDSRVEGQAAVKDLLSGIAYFKDKDIDALVIIRGGGSLESLQAFNNEILVRAIADFPRPIICGIGHDKDVPLASLTADLMVSTPSIVTAVLNQSWDKAIGNVRIFEKDLLYQYQKIFSDQKHRIEILTNQLIVSRYQKALLDGKRQIETLAGQLKEKSNFIFQRFAAARNRLMNKLGNLGFALKTADQNLTRARDLILGSFRSRLEEIEKYLGRAEEGLRNADPKRQLRLGYSIVSAAGQVLKSVSAVKPGEGLDIRVSDGKIKSRVEEIISGK